MLPYEPESTSELLRATHILKVLVLSVVWSGWEPDGPMLEYRRGVVLFRLERILKGELAGAAEEEVEVNVEQYANTGARFVAVPGAWSRALLEEGSCWLVLSRSGGSDTVSALGLKAVLRVEPAGLLVSELDFLIESATPGLPLPALVEQLAVRRTSLSLLTGRYVAWRLRELLFTDLTGFDSVLSQVEHALTAAPFRSVILIEAYDDLLMLEPAAAEFVARLIWGSFRMFGAGIGRELASRILGIYVPNLVGIEGGQAIRAASEVFERHPAWRGESVSILRQGLNLPGRERVLEWLES